MTSTETVLQAENIEVTFDSDRGESKVVDDISIDIQREEVLGIVGESGSGKSMLASALLNAVVDPGRVSGSVTYNPEEGEPLDVLDLSKRQLRKYRWDEVAMVFQGAMSSFNPTLSIKGHFEETLKAHGKSVEEGLEYTDTILSDLYLDPNRVMNSYPHELSGGMQQRVLIALSLILNPEVLVMDEPTAALDLLMQRSILELLREIKESYEITLIFITHDLPLVTELADRMAVMYAFSIVELGPTEAIVEGSGHPYTRALLNAIPNVHSPIENMNPIEGSSPDPVDTPSGCSYHLRCSLSDEQCRQSDPDFKRIAENHEARCHYWEEARKSTHLHHKREVKNE